MRCIVGKYASIWGWDPDDQEWDWYIPDFEMNTLDSLRVGGGYWINATQACWWDPSDTAAGLPKPVQDPGEERVPPLPFVLCGGVKGLCTGPCEVSLRDEAGTVLARYRMGSNPDYGDRYVLRVPGPQGYGVVYVGEQPACTTPIPMEAGTARWLILPGRGMPVRYALYPNIPNPFNAFTTIAYDLPRASEVRLTIYAITGQQVAAVVSGPQEGGHYEVVWDGSGGGTGIYLYRLEAGSFVETRHMALIK